MSHKHNWRTNFIVIDFVDHVSGMICDCGETLTQDEVEDIVNKHIKIQDILLAKAHRE